MKVIIVPGNGCTPVLSSSWYGWLKSELENSRVLANKITEVRLENMPDPSVARETIWIPFILRDLGADEDSIVVGHSSGAVAAMRLLEENKLKGAILVSACHTDLGEENERASGYYSRPWEWDKIKQNAEFIAQYHSTDDPFIPISEARHVHENLDTEYFEFNDRSHFFEPFPEIVEYLEGKICSLLEEGTSDGNH